MGFQELIKENLLGYIKRMYCKNDDEFSGLVNHYGDEGEEEFYADLDRAAEALVGLSQYEFTDIYENLRDVKPMKIGVLLCESLVSGGGTYTLKFMESCRGTDIPIEGFVYDWAKDTLENPYYADLLSHSVQFGEKTVDQDGVLSGLGFEATSSTYLLITDRYEFLPVRVNEIYIEFSNGERLELYKNVVIDEKTRSFVDLEDLLEEITDFGSCLRVAR